MLPVIDLLKWYLWSYIEVLAALIPEGRGRAYPGSRSVEYPGEMLRLLLRVEMPECL